MQMSDEEEDIKDIYFIKNNNNISNSDSISALSENASTYLGVKTIPEGTIPDNNKSVKKKKSKKANKNKKTHNKENKRNIDSFSSNSSSSSSQNFSSSSSSPSNSSSIDFEYLKDKKKNKNSKKKKKTKENEKNTKTKKKQKNRTIKEIKEKNGEINKNSEKNGENEKKIGKKKAIKKDEIETFFEWDEGGNEVYLTGSFCDWKEFFLMTKNKDGKFTITLPLPRGFHQYKFKIDDNWTYSKKQPKFEDNGNVNNFIDTTDFNNLNEEKKEEDYTKGEIIKKEKNKQKMEKNTKIGDKIGKSNDKKRKKRLSVKFKLDEEEKKAVHKRNSSIQNIHFLNNQNIYSTYYPLRAEFNKRPLALPGLYKTYYILDEKKNKKIKDRKFSQIEYVDSTNNSIYDNISDSFNQSQSFNNSLCVINDVNPYVKFQNLYHIHSNHLHTKELMPKKSTIVSIISRYRFKFSTFIYYKENEPIIEFDKKKHSKTIRIKKTKTQKYL